MKRQIMAAGAGLLLSASFCITALAAPKTMRDGVVFDPEYYAAQNPDVVNALGSDEDVLYNHDKNYGKSEGRLPYAPGDTSAGNAYASEGTGVCTIELDPQTRYLKAGNNKTQMPTGVIWSNQTCLTMTENDTDPTGVIEIWRADAYDGQYVLAGQTNDTYAPVWYDTNLEPGKEYFYKIRRLKGTAVSGFSGVQAYWTAPAEVKSPVLKNGKLTWPSVSGASGYIVMQYTSLDTGTNARPFGVSLDQSVVVPFTVTEPSFTVPKALRRTTHTYSVLPYAVHDGYYYVNGIPAMESLTEVTALLACNGRANQ